MTISGELKQWHKTTIDIVGPEVGEVASTFTDFRMDVTFTHESGAVLTVPGFFAADGNAAETGATSGDIWRANFSAPLVGEWSYEVTLVTGENVAALRDAPGTAVDLGTQASGSFSVTPTDKTGLDSRAHGTLVDENFDGYLERKGSGEAWLKTGVDSPENFLAYEEFDGTVETRGPAGTARYVEHVDSFGAGDPTWRGGLGDEIIGATNYLAAQGVNSVYIMTMTIGGDGQDTSPFVDQENLNAIPRTGSGLGTNKTMAEAVAAIDGVEFDDFVTYDVSKLAQWDVLFDHMQANGQNLHLILQETENDQLLNDTGLGTTDPSGDLSIERAIYMREMVARFGHNNYITWNLGEENTQSSAEREAMFAEIDALDAYGHTVAIHTFPGQQSAVYTPLLGNPDVTGASLQTSAFNQTADAVSRWVEASADAGQRWIVMADETSDASTGVAPDSQNPGHNDARSEGLWGALMSGAGGIEWYMGGNDQNLSDFSTREEMYRQATVARGLFEEFLPFTEMSNDNALLDLSGGREGYVFAKPEEVYLVYTEDGDQSVNLDLTGIAGEFVGYWFDPVGGGLFELGSVERVSGGGVVSFGVAPAAVRDGRVADTVLTSGREALIEDAVLLVKRVDVDLGITADDVAQGRLAEGDLGTEVNQPPVVNDVTVEILEDSEFTDFEIAADAFGFDPEGETLFFDTATGAQNGSTTIFASGFFLNYTPDPDFNGTEVIEVTISDRTAQGTSQSSATLTINVLPVNDDPTVSNGFFEVTNGNPVTIDLRGLAFDVDGDDLTFTLVSGAEQGTVTASADGLFTFDADADADGSDFFIFEVSDGQGGSAQGRANLGIALPPTTETLIAAVNIGSNTDYAAQDGTVFVADTISTGRRFSSNIAIANTEDDPLYQTEAWTPGASLDYAFNVENGEYRVELFFADIFSGTSQPGQRVFDVEVEGLLVEDGLDLSGDVGFATAFISENVVSVEDGVLNISLIDGIENPKLSALRITSLAEPINEPPVAVDDVLTFTSDDVFIDPDTGIAQVSFVSFDFLDNDIEDFVGTPPDQQEFFTPNYLIGDEPDFGEFQIAGEGTFVTYFFDPAAFPGSDSFTYRRQDSADFELFSNEATVTIEIDGLPPVAPPEASLSLVDALTDEVLFELGGRTIIDEDALVGRSLSALVATTRSDVESATLTLFDRAFGGGTAVSTQTENIEPYALFGDRSGNFTQGDLAIDEVFGARIAATLFTQNGGGGDLVASDEASLFVQNGLFSDDFNLTPDLFAFDETVMGEDVIRNFSELDSLVFFGGTLQSAGDILARASLVDGGTLIDFGSGNSLFLQGFDSLSADDIVFPLEASGANISPRMDALAAAALLDLDDTLSRTSLLDRSGFVDPAAEMMTGETAADLA